MVDGSRDLTVDIEFERECCWQLIVSVSRDGTYQDGGDSEVQEPPSIEHGAP